MERKNIMNAGIIVHLSLDAFDILWIYALCIVFLLYRSVLYKKHFLPNYDSTYTPSVSIFVPCKGVNDHFEANIATFTRIEYPLFRLFFIVESEQDPAYPVIQRIISGKENAALLVAGKSATCGQKNHNLLHGVEKAGAKDDVYVFMDSDIPVNAAWIRNLLAPLSSPKVMVSTGFRWLVLKKGTIGEYFHAFVSAFQLALVNFPLFSGVWGGSMAIRRADFERLGVKDYWGKTVVDDSSLQWLIMKAKGKVVHVPECVAETNETIPTLWGVVKWFKRQSSYVKYYLRPFWLFGMVIYIYAMLNFLLLPVFIVVTSVHYTPVNLFVTLYTAVYVILVMLWGMLLKKPGKDNHKRILWFFYMPVFVFAGTCAGIMTCFSKRMDWSGIRYHLDFHGIVKKIER